MISTVSLDIVFIILVFLVVVCLFASVFSESTIIYKDS